MGVFIDHGRVACQNHAIMRDANIPDEDITIAANAGIMVESVAGEVYSFVFCFSLGWLKSIHLDKKQHK